MVWAWEGSVTTITMVGSNIMEALEIMVASIITAEDMDTVDTITADTLIKIFRIDKN